MSNYYCPEDQLLNKGGLTLVSKPFYHFGTLLMMEVSKLSLETFGILGNREIDDPLKQILSNKELQQSFVTQCSTFVNKPEQEKSHILALFNKLCTKTIHVWAGEQSWQYKAVYTGRQARNTTKLLFRNDLNSTTKKKS